MTTAGDAGRFALEQRLRHLVDARNLREGDKIGSERDLADKLGVTRTALRGALDELVRAGLVRRVPGRTGGVFMRSPKVRDLSELLGVPQFLRQQGYVAGTQVLSANLRTATENVAERLQLASVSPVYDLVRVRLADGEPISLEHVYIPADLAPALLEKPLTGSLADVLVQDYGITSADCTESIEVRLASPQEAELLGVAVDAPLLSLERVSIATTGRVFEYSHDLFRADKMRLVVHASRAGNGAPHPTERQTT